MTRYSTRPRYGLFLLARGRRDQAAFAYRKVALTDFREVEDALASVERLGEEETAVGAEREVYARTLKLASNR